MCRKYKNVLELVFSDGNPPPPIHFNSTTTKLDKNSFCKVALIPFPTIQKGFSTPLPPPKKMCGPTHQLSFKIGQNCLCGPILPPFPLNWPKMTQWTYPIPSPSSQTGQSSLSETIPHHSSPSDQNCLCGPILPPFFLNWAKMTQWTNPFPFVPNWPKFPLFPHR